MDDQLARLGSKGKKRRIVIISFSLLILAVLAVAIFFPIPTKFKWMDGKSSLGVLLENESFEADSDTEYTVAYLAGIPQKPHRSPDGYWALPVYFGEHKSTGDPVVVSWFFGRDDDPVVFVESRDDEPVFDPSLNGTSIYNEEQTTVKEFLENISYNRVFPMRLVIGIAGDNPSDCVDGFLDAVECEEQITASRQVVDANRDVFLYINGEVKTLPESVLSFPPTFYFLQNESYFEKIRDFVFRKADAQSWTYEGQWWVDQECANDPDTVGIQECLRQDGDGSPYSSWRSGVSCDLGSSDSSVHTIYTKQREVTPADYSCNRWVTSEFYYTTTVTSCTWVAGGCYYGYCWSGYWWCRPVESQPIKAYNYAASCALQQSEPVELWCSGENGDCPVVYTEETCSTWTTKDQISGATNAGCTIQTRDVEQSCGYPGPAVSCTAGSWTNQSCGGGSCDDDQMYQTRTTNPSGCVVSSRCISSTACVPAGATCGNGSLDAGEQCDLGSSNGACPSTCSNICQINNCSPQCGNGIEDAGESCDDGNSINGDGCSSTCEVESSGLFCGNGIVEGTEICDGTTNCRSDCTLAECVDGSDNDGNGDIDASDPQCVDCTLTGTCDGGGGCTGGGCGTCTGLGCDDSEEDDDPDVWIEANPKVSQSGGQTELSWGVRNLGDISGISCSSSANPDNLNWGDGVAVTTGGERFVTLTLSGLNVFTITCTNSENESQSADARVLVSTIKEVAP